MNVLPSNSDEQSASARPSPLALAAFIVALIIGGALIWMSFAGGNAPPAEVVMVLPAPSDTPQTAPEGAETGVSTGADSGATIGVGPASDAGATAASPRQEATAAPPPDALQRIGSRAVLPAGAALPPAPIEGLYEQSGDGVLPIIAADGARPVASYGRPFPAAKPGGRPRIAILITGLGLNRSFADRTLEQLPADISLAYSPYANDLQMQIDAARADGHEVALEVPMEPFDYPDNDPGPYTLLTSLPHEANAKRLNWLLARGAGYFAAINRQGGRYLADPAALAPSLAALQARGLGFIDTGTGARSATAQALPEGLFDWATADVAIDVTTQRTPLADALAGLEETARNNQIALGVATALPVTVDHIAEWAQGLEDKGFELVPASAVLAQDGG